MKADRPRRGRGGFAPVRDAFKGSPEGLPDAAWTQLRVVAAWLRAVGPQLAKRLRPLDCDPRGTLTIAVPSQEWARDLEAHREALRQRVAVESGVSIRTLVFEVRPEPPGPGAGEPRARKAARPLPPASAARDEIGPERAGESEPEPDGGPRPRTEGETEST